MGAADSPSLLQKVQTFEASPALAHALAPPLDRSSLDLIGLGSLQAIVATWLRQGKRVRLCAPTGRAAQRLQVCARNVCQCFTMWYANYAFFVFYQFFQLQ